MYKIGNTDLIANDDKIEIDLEKKSINLLVDIETLNNRRMAFGNLPKKNKPCFKGTLGKFSRHVGGIKTGYLMD